MKTVFPPQSCWPTTATAPPNNVKRPVNDDDGNGWTDVPPDPAPNIIPGPEVDTSALRRNLGLQGRQSADLREAARRSEPDSEVKVVSVSPKRGQVRFTDPDGTTWVETWIRSDSSWRPARD